MPDMISQVTRLQCGGFVFANRINHTMCDATGLVQFLNAIAEIARGSAPSPTIQPVWQRELLFARELPQISFKHHEYEEIHDANRTSVEIQSVDRSFIISHREISSLRKHLFPHLQNCSMFEILTAVVWRCHTIALNIDSINEVGFALCANARPKFNPPLPSGFYGNAIGFPVTFSNVNQLCQNPLWYAVELVRQTKAKMTEEYIRSAIDFLVKRGRPGFEESRTFCVSDLRHMGFNNIDFGWGNAKYAGLTGTVFSMTYYLPWRNSKNEEGIVLLMNLPEPAMERFALEIEKVMKTQHGRETDAFSVRSNL